MRVLIVGAGAVGRYLAACLRLAGHDAVLLARPESATSGEASYPLRAGGKDTAVSIPIATTPGDAAVRDPFELAITAVKSFATQSSIESIQALPACAASTILVVQNGLGNEEQCVAAFGAERVVAGALTTAVERAGEAIVASRSGGLSIAPLGTSPHNWIIAAFETTRIKIAAAGDWRALKWSKLLMNLQANAICAILDWPPTRVYADPVGYSLERACLLEALATMDVLRISPVPLIDLPVPLFVTALRRLPSGMFRALLGRRITGARGDKLPSMLIDLRKGVKQLEVDALNGAVAARATEQDVATPVNAAVTRILDGIAAGTLSWDHYRGKPTALAKFA